MILFESNLTPAEKMEAWHAGTRRENYRVVNDEKLTMYYNICVAKGFDEQAELLKAEGQKRKLAWSGVDIEEEDPDEETEVDTAKNSISAALGKQQADPDDFMDDEFDDFTDEVYNADIVDKDIRIKLLKDKFNEKVQACIRGKFTEQIVKELNLEARKHRFNRYDVKNTEELVKLIKQVLDDVRKPNVGLCWIGTGKVKYMNDLFNSDRYSSENNSWSADMWNAKQSVITLIGKFNGDISKWDTSNVTDMHGMFYGSHFNGDISSWNTSNVTSMRAMFMESDFNGDISSWNTIQVKNMCNMFKNSQFNRDISNWDTRSLQYADYMFMESKFTKDISKWNVSNLQSIKYMFSKTAVPFNLSNWDLSHVTNAQYLFDKANFISGAKLPKVIGGNDCSHLFSMATNIGNVADSLATLEFSGDKVSAENMFYNIQFGGAPVKLVFKNSKLYDIRCMFEYSKGMENVDLSEMNVKYVELSRCVFYASDFTGNISKWELDQRLNTRDTWDGCKVHHKRRPAGFIATNNYSSRRWW